METIMLTPLEHAIISRLKPTSEKTEKSNSPIGIWETTTTTLCAPGVKLNVVFNQLVEPIGYDYEAYNTETHIVTGSSLFSKELKEYFKDSDVRWLLK